MNFTPGEAARRPELEVHHSHAARLPAAAIQARCPLGQAPQHSHGHQARHNPGAVAVHQGAPAAGRRRKGVHQLGQVPAADLRVRAHSLLGHSEQAAHALYAAGSDCHQPHDKHRGQRAQENIHL